MDVFGEALNDYFTGKREEILWLHNSYDEPEEMPLDLFFRKERDMPDLELRALRECRGAVLDVGAGVGSHVLALQRKGLCATAMDHSASAVEIMRTRGVKRAFQADFFDDGLSQKFDTLLFLMNGIGITGTISGFTAFLSRAEQLLLPGGQLLFDSSDIRYLYHDKPLPGHAYFGEVSYQYEYKGQRGNWFNWLYLDQATLKQLASAYGWHYEMLYDDGEDQYLARLAKKD